MHYRWAGHCKSLQPIWEEVATDLKGDVNVGEVDCTDGTNKAVCSRFEVKGYPTLKFFHKGEVFAYKGTRAKEAISTFARTGYTDVVGEKVPAVVTWLDGLWKVIGIRLTAAKKDISKVCLEHIST
jgi:thiol-disulfide isomerase/thioredoxin